MQNFSFVVALRIWHPNIDPAVITGKLGISPEWTHKAGSQRTTPKGRPLAGSYATLVVHGHLCTLSQRAADRSLERWQ